VAELSSALALTIVRLSVGKQPGRITLGSGCSGWCSEAFALEDMGLKFSHEFGCDNHLPCKLACKLLHPKIRHWFDDITSDVFQSAPTVDLFFGGFPCQPFSTAGALGGMQDGRGRGLIIMYLIRYIFQRRPKCFVLENVAGLLTRFPEVMKDILSGLLAMTDAKGGKLYDVTWRKLNCCKHGGLPQNRERIFIVGLLRSAQVHATQWPSEVGRSFVSNTHPHCQVPMQPLVDLLEPHDPTTFKALPPKKQKAARSHVIRARAQMKERGLEAEEAVVDIGSSRGHWCPLFVVQWPQ
jgi:DNA-cytosine methyltransferase